MKAILLVEYGLTLVAAVIVLSVPSFARPDRVRKLWFLFGRLANRRALSIIAVGAFALSLRVAVLPRMPVPEPQIHDELSSRSGLGAGSGKSICRKCLGWSSGQR